MSRLYLVRQRVDLGAVGACSSSDWRYLRQPRRNSGQTGTVGSGSVFSGSSFHYNADFGVSTRFAYVLDRTDGTLLRAMPFVKKLTWASRIGADGRPVLNANQAPTPAGTTVCPAVEGAATPTSCPAVSGSG